MTFSFEAIGTHWKIDIEGGASAETEHNLLNRIRERIAVFDKHYSRFRDDSLVMEMARTAGVYTLPDDAKPMMDTYATMYSLTKGAMTPLIGQVLVDAGYDATYSLQTKPMQQAPAWDDVLVYDFPKLTIKQPAILDFGAAGKGYLIDIVAEVIREAGFTSYCVDAGGDIAYRGPQPLRIGLENPNNVGEAIGVAEVHNQSICGSAGNRRAWGEFHHIINPSTLTSPRDIAAVWVIADTTLVADALTTALFFVPPSALTNTFTFQYLILNVDFTVERSANFPAELFTA